jgi:uncharacterized protein (UPF0303 family)
MTDIADQLAEIDRADHALTLSWFTADDAWTLGARLRDIAAARHAQASIEIRRCGSTVFAASLDGATADTAGWASRKTAVALRFERSSLAVALDLRARGLTLEDFGLSRAVYAAAAGAVPIRVAGVGCVGAVAMSGLAGMEDHALVVEAIGDLRVRQVRR